MADEPQGDLPGLFREAMTLLTDRHDEDLAWARQLRAPIERAESLLGSLVPADVRIKASIGTGRIAQVPWIAFFLDGDHTTTGYYVVFLFAADGSAVYLVLMLGVTSTDINAIARNREALRDHVEAPPAIPHNAESQIDLRATSGLAARYERATALSIRYTADTLPSEAELAEAANAFIATYRATKASGFRTPIPDDVPSPGPGARGQAPPPDPLDALADGLYLDRDYLRDVDWLLRDRRQLVFYGPPGTGKTFVAEAYAAWFTGDESQVETIQFHASYAYEDFMEGIRPVLDADELRYARVDGVLKRMAAEAAARPDERFVLIIDEINRANLARVFGELLYLLEYRDRSIRLPYSGELFALPPNLYLIGTMNTADRSIALVDFALRRRFHFVEFPADSTILRRWLEANNPDMVEVARYLEWMNRSIGDHDFAIGFSYFMRDDLDGVLLRRIWARSILPALAEFYFDNAERRAQFALDAVIRAVRQERGAGLSQDEGPGD